MSTGGFAITTCFKICCNRRLKHRFKQEGIRALHKNASTWFAENGHVEEAIQHALAGGDIERAVEIVGNAVMTS